LRFSRASHLPPWKKAHLIALEQLIDLGVRRVMTSGQQESALNGGACIARLIEQAAGRIEVLPAGGINRFTVADVLARTSCDQVHASLRLTRFDHSTATRRRTASTPPDERPNSFLGHQHTA
jgi:copper homeostasis protein